MQIIRKVRCQVKDRKKGWKPIVVPVIIEGIGDDATPEEISCLVVHEVENVLRLKGYAEFMINPVPIGGSK